MLIEGIDWEKWLSSELSKKKIKYFLMIHKNLWYLYIFRYLEP